MIGVLRAAWLFVAGTRFQRALLAAVPVLQCLGLLWYRLDPPCRRCLPLGPVVLDSLSTMSLAGSLLMGGVMFRAMAAPRMLRLIPCARLQLLSGVVLSLSLLTGLMTCYAVLCREFAPGLHVPSGSVLGTYCGALELTALWVVWGFLLFGRSVWLRWLLIIGAFPGVLVLGMQYRDIAGALDVGVTTEFAVIAAVTVLPFVAWYLRAPLIAFPDLVLTDPNQLVVFRPRSVQAVGKSAATATNVYLLGQTSVPRACWLWAFCSAATNLVVVLYLLKFRPHIEPSYAFPLVLSTVFGCGIAFSTQIVRRARTLWIRSGSTRRELFNRVEKLSLGCFAFTGIPSLVIGSAELTHLGFDRAAYLLLLTTSTGLCCVYGALLNVRRQSVAADPLSIALVCVTWLFLLPDSPHFLFEESGPWALQGPLAELLAVPLLRAIAVNRWQRIDWLICKLPKTAFQRLRLAR